MEKFPHGGKSPEKDGGEKNGARNRIVPLLKKALAGSTMTPEEKAEYDALVARGDELREEKEKELRRKDKEAALRRMLKKRGISRKTWEGAKRNLHRQRRVTGDDDLK